MALQGTLKDFGLAEIFQLIGIQRTTGVLTLDNDQDSVVIKFLEGQVVGADTRSETLESRLGTVLVRTGRITQAQLQEALETQRTSLQRLGHILVHSGRISEEELIEALRIQSSEIIYRLFRWRDGSYRFHKAEDVEYDRSHFTPINSETILMEGARMIDEWPIIERKVRSPKLVLTRTAAARRVSAAGEPGLDAGLDAAFGFDRPAGAGEPTPADAPEVMRLTTEERIVLGLVDGRRSVGEVCDLVSLGEFETYRILADLMTRSLVEEVPEGQLPGTAQRERLADRLLPWAALAGLALLALLTLLTLGTNPLTPWRLLARDPATEQLRLYSSMARLEQVSAAVEVYYLDRGEFPASIQELAQAGYLHPSELRDPWGREYAYSFSSGGYSLAGLDGSGTPRRDLALSRHLDAIDQLVAAPTPRP
jgi:hypothetical protein